MSMRFDPKTGKMIGKMTRMTPEETKAFYARAEADPAGMLGPPDLELLEQMEKQRAAHGVGWGLKQLRAKLYGV